MKRWYIVHVALHVFMYALGFYFLQWDAQIAEEFWRVGWENYDGLDLDFTENTYYALWVLVCLFSMFLARINDTDVKLDRFWQGANFFFLVSYALCYFSDGSISMKESMIGWHLTPAVQIIIVLLLYNHDTVSSKINFTRKQFFGLNSLAYFALLGLGFYCLQWDDNINNVIAETRAAGGDIYDTNGMYSRPEYDNDVPENRYHLILTVVNVITLLLLFIGNEKSTQFNTYKGLMVVFCLYSVFVYINDGNPDMRETMLFWFSLCLSSAVISARLWRQTANNIPPLSPSNDILDDLANLE